jgi:hypothetical protein
MYSVIQGMAITFIAAAIVVIIKIVLIGTKIFLAEKHVVRLLEAMCVSFNNTGVKIHHIQKD